MQKEMVSDAQGGLISKASEVHFGRADDGRGVCSGRGELTQNVRLVTCEECKDRLAALLVEVCGMSLYRQPFGRFVSRYMYTAPEEMQELGFKGSGLSFDKTGPAGVDGLRSLHAFLGQMMEVLS